MCYNFPCDDAAQLPRKREAKANKKRSLLDPHTRKTRFQQRQVDALLYLENAATENPTAEVAVAEEPVAKEPVSEDAVPIVQEARRRPGRPRLQQMSEESKEANISSA